MSVENPASIHHCIRQAFANQTGRDSLPHINQHDDTVARLSDEYGFRWRSAFEGEFSNGDQSHVFGRLNALDEVIVRMESFCTATSASSPMNCFEIPCLRLPPLEQKSSKETVPFRPICCR
jgi:hypothetical protein